eukprot:5049949-Alexandrium_andersonii.AAC.1
MCIRDSFRAVPALLRFSIRRRAQPAARSGWCGGRPSEGQCCQRNRAWHPRVHAQLLAFGGREALEETTILLQL